MSKTPPRPPRPSESSLPGLKGAPNPDVERALALRDVMDHVVKVEKEITAPTLLNPSRARVIIAAALCLPAIAFCVYSWTTRPEFIWGPRPTAVSAVRHDADLRVAMFLLAQRLHAHRRKDGTYPATLDAVGGPVAGVAYALLSDSLFELRATHDGTQLTLRSGDAADAFLGNSAGVIAAHLK